jgi:hypothetical protein
LTVTNRPGFERSHFSISWRYNVFEGPMKALSKGYILWMLWGWGQIMKILDVLCCPFSCCS